MTAHRDLSAVPNGTPATAVGLDGKRFGTCNPLAKLRAQGWSTTRIAEAVGVSDASVRRDLSPSTFVEPEATNATVIGLDGKRYPAKKKPAVFALV